METSMAIRTVLELLAGLFVIWAVYNEEKFIRFEDKVIAHFKAKRGADND